HVTVPSAPTFFSSSGTGRSGVMMEMLAVAYGSKHVPVIVTVEPASYELASVEALAGTPVHAPGGVGAPAAGGASTTAGAAAHVIASRSPAPSRTVAWPRRTNIGTPSTRQNGPVILYGASMHLYCPVSSSGGKILQ